jgi:hypothetical protein
MTKEEAFEKAMGLYNGEVYGVVSADDGFRKGCLESGPSPHFTVYINGYTGIGASYEEAFDNWENKINLERKEKINRLRKELAAIGGEVV